MVLKSNRSCLHDTSVLNPYFSQIFFSLKGLLFDRIFSSFVLAEWCNLVTGTFCMREFHWLEGRKQGRKERERKEERRKRRERLKDFEKSVKSETGRVISKS